MNEFTNDFFCQYENLKENSDSLKWGKAKHVTVYVESSAILRVYRKEHKSKFRSSIKKSLYWGVHG